MNMKYFAIISMTLLFMAAAGLVARSFHEWVELGAEGGPYVWDAEWCCSTEGLEHQGADGGPYVWDADWCCNMETPFWGFLRAIFGYDSRDPPTVLEFTMYWMFWAILSFVCWHFKVFDSPKSSASCARVD
jgi:high-affinity Fe2+/Pb2+ permease